MVTVVVTGMVHHMVVTMVMVEDMGMLHQFMVHTMEITIKMVSGYIPKIH